MIVYNNSLMLILLVCLVGQLLLVQVMSSESMLNAVIDPLRNTVNFFTGRFNLSGQSRENEVVTSWEHAL